MTRVSFTMKLHFRRLVMNLLKLFVCFDKFSFEPSFRTLKG
jgi:hypothetical protein